MTPTQESPAAKVQEMLVSVVLDRSGSMATNVAGTISGYNEFLHGLKQDKDTKYSVSLTQFDSPSMGPELTVSYDDKALSEVPQLDAKTYEPRGGTPLFDAIGECIRRVAAKGRAVMMAIITDGEENSSHEFTSDSVKKLISEKEAEGWKFVFLGANIDSFAIGGALGFAAANVANYAPGQERNLYSTVARSASLHASNVRNFGMTAATASMDTIGASARASMMGGRPAAPPPFQSPVTKSKPTGTKWTVRDSVSGT